MSKKLIGDNVPDTGPATLPMRPETIAVTGNAIATAGPPPVPMVSINEICIQRAIRRIREEVLNGQQHRGTGWIKVDIHLSDGNADCDARVHIDWVEKLR